MLHRAMWAVVLSFAVAACSDANEHVAVSTIKARSLRTMTITVPDSSPLVLDVDWVGDSGIVYVPSPGTSLRLMRWSGKHVTMGRSGSGPGEFRGVATVAADDRHVVAVDGYHRRASVWNVDGKLLREDALELLHLDDLWRTDSGFVLRSHSRTAGRILLSRLDPESGQQHLLRTIDIASPGADNGCRYCKIGVGRSLDVALGVAGDSLYMIRRFDASGTEQPPIDHGVYRVPKLTSEERDDIVAFRNLEVARRSDNPMLAKSLRDAFDALPIRSHKSLFASAPYVDEQRRVWIQRSVRQHAPVLVDVIVPDGMRSVVELPPGSRLYGVRHGVMLVVRSVDGSDRYVEEYELPAFR